MASAPVQLDEQSLIREQIAQIELPEGVRFKRFVLGSEWTGEAAWFIHFSVSRKIPLTKQFLDRLGKIRTDPYARIFPLRTDKLSAICARLEVLEVVARAENAFSASAKVRPAQEATVFLAALLFAGRWSK